MANNKLKKSNTCLAVLREKGTKKRKGELVFAADRRISWGSSSQYQIGVRPKVIKRNGIIMAGTGSAYLCDIVCELVPIPDIPKDCSNFNYMHQIFRESLKNTLTQYGFANKDNDICFPEDFSATVLVGLRGDLFEITLGDHIGIGIDAIDVPYGEGCGGKYALGSLKTTEYLKMNVKDRLQIALNVAAELSSGCDNNIDIVRESDEDSTN